MEQEKPVDLDEAEKKIEKAGETLSYLCTETWAGRLKGAWHWEIPANPERDTDLILGDAIEIAAQATKEIRSLRAENARLKGQVIPVRFRVTIGEHNAEIEVSPSASPEYHQGMVTIAIKEVLRRANAKGQAEAVGKLVEAAKAFCEQLKFIHDDTKYKGVWQISQIHVGPYTGPQYEKEFESLCAALSNLEAKTP